MILVNKCSRGLTAIQAFYDSCGYRGTITAEDTFTTATDGEHIIGVVRLSREEGVLVLRGMEISPGYQRQGIGTRMLQVLDGQIGKQACWGIAKKHLEGFYGQIGFRFVEEDCAPEHLQSRLRTYLARRPNYNVIMFRAPPV